MVQTYGVARADEREYEDVGVNASSSSPLLGTSAVANKDDTSGGHGSVIGSAGNLCNTIMGV